MSIAPSALREPWEELADQARVSRFGMWAFIASEVLFFGGVFMAYTFVRTLHPAAFAEAAHETDLWFGGANTAVLITSSFTVVMGAKAAALDLRRPAAVLLAVTALLGLAFLAIKGVEYGQDIREHLVPGQDFKLPDPAAQIFFSFYWGITGLHALHLSVGIALVGRLAWLLHRDRLSTRSPQVEVTSLYWGFVDMVWMVVFPLLYLGGGRA